jgi:hypothetical protein
MESNVVYVADGDIKFWIENGSSLMIRAITKFGDAVELSSEEALELSNKLVEYANQIR